MGEPLEALRTTKRCVIPWDPLTGKPAFRKDWMTTEPECVGIRMRPWNTFETIASRMLARQGIGVIWELHVRAAACYRRGNWLSAVALVGIADAAERLWRGII